MAIHANTFRPARAAVRSGAQVNSYLVLRRSQRVMRELSPASANMPVPMKASSSQAQRISAVVGANPRAKKPIVFPGRSSSSSYSAPSESYSAPSSNGSPPILRKSRASRSPSANSDRSTSSSRAKKPIVFPGRNDSSSAGDSYSSYSAPAVGRQPERTDRSRSASRARKPIVFPGRDSSSSSASDSYSAPSNGGYSPPARDSRASRSPSVSRSVSSSRVKKPIVFPGRNDNSSSAGDSYSSYSAPAVGRQPERTDRSRSASRARRQIVFPGRDSSSAPSSYSSEPSYSAPSSSGSRPPLARKPNQRPASTSGRSPSSDRARRPIVFPR